MSYMTDDESPKKEEEFLGIPMSKLGAPALVVGGLALLASIAVPFLKPQIEQAQRDMQNRQAYAQQQQQLAAQAQQQQIQQQSQYSGDPNQGIPQEHQAQPEQEKIPETGPQYAVEQDPFNRQAPRRVRIPEVESESSGSNRFNNISI